MAIGAIWKDSLAEYNTKHEVSISDGSRVMTKVKIFQQTDREKKRQVKK